MTLLVFLAALAALAFLEFSWRKKLSRAQREIEWRNRELDRLHNALQESQSQARAQAQALFNSMREGVLLLDAQQRVELANAALIQLFHLPDHLEGRTVLELFRQHELAGIVREIATAGHVLNAPLELTAPHPLFLEINASRVGSAEAPEGYLLVFHDLTQLHHLENIRKEFVANVSHELRTPLSLIQGYVETLLSGAVSDPAVATRFLHILKKQSDRLNLLVEDLLVLSQLESGSIELHPREISLSSLVDRVFHDLQERAQARAVTLQNNVGPQTTTHADVERLEQVLSNLIENGIKYGRAPGLVSVAAVYRPDDHLTEISVTDDGPGIPLEARERIFERFFRVDRARSREQGGTGLGLAIVKHIVQAHHGRVWVECPPAGGSIFHFCLPSPASTG